MNNIMVNSQFLEKMLAAMEGVIDVADRKTDEFEELRSCVIDLTLMLYAPPQRTEQEPVAWHYPGGKPDQCTTDKAYAEIDPAWTPMYYKHEFVGLTDEDEIDWDEGDLKSLIKAIEAKLKEKNT
jgi:hypothetical protein